MNNDPLAHSTPCSRQALQEQAHQYLPIITKALGTQCFSEIAHQRIAQQGSTHQYYQGLVRAQHPQFGAVMIKWQSNARHHQHSPSDLTHEAHVIRALNTRQTDTPHAPYIVPPLLAYRHVPMPECRQTLTLMVMPYYPHASLATLLKAYGRRPFSPSQTQYLIKQSAHLLATLHQAGWLHNDIKPSNILLDAPDAALLSAHRQRFCPAPTLLLTDFALAQRHIYAEGASTLAGTPAYIAPERWQGQAPTSQTDVYAFGVMLYEILTNKRPFHIDRHCAEPLKQWAIRHCQKPVPTLPFECGRYQQVVNKTLAKSVGKRYLNMEAVLEDLECL